VVPRIFGKFVDAWLNPEHGDIILQNIATYNPTQYNIRGHTQKTNL
jgi:hypothetical protein